MMAAATSLQTPISPRSPSNGVLGQRQVGPPNHIYVYQAAAAAPTSAAASADVPLSPPLACRSLASNDHPTQAQEFTQVQLPGVHDVIVSLPDNYRLLGGTVTTSPIFERLAHRALRSYINTTPVGRGKLIDDFILASISRRGGAFVEWCEESQQWKPVSQKKAREFTAREMKSAARQVLRRIRRRKQQQVAAAAHLRRQEHRRRLLQDPQIHKNYYFLAPPLVSKESRDDCGGDRTRLSEPMTGDNSHRADEEIVPGVADKSGVKEAMENDEEHELSANSQQDESSAPGASVTDEQEEAASNPLQQQQQQQQQVPSPTPSNVLERSPMRFKFKRPKQQGGGVLEISLPPDTSGLDILTHVASQL